MSLKKTVGYGPLIEPVIEEKIMKHEPLKRKEKHRRPPPRGAMIRQQLCLLSFFTINGNKFISGSIMISTLFFIIN